MSPTRDRRKRTRNAPRPEAARKPVDRSVTGLPHQPMPEWRFRTFPGTWQQAVVEAQSQAHPSARWIWDPVESWGEAFRAAITLEVKEKTLDYGKTIDPVKTRAFFISLMNAPR